MQCRVGDAVLFALILGIAETGDKLELLLLGQPNVDGFAQDLVASAMDYPDGFASPHQLLVEEIIQFADGGIDALAVQVDFWCFA